ncbi:MAG: ComF family protein [Pseudanabaena sp. RU_4_16]|nr:ComF family protein [Pseudanabaena sp. RU_4_16]NKB17786.1 ComF family protein [Pseudanabaena sp. CRU_2_10]
MWQRLNWDKFLDGFFQSKCLLCQRSTPDRICLDCDRQINSCRYPQFHQPLASHAAPMLFSWGIYDGALKRAIAACKYDRHPDIATLLGMRMGQVWQQDIVAQRIFNSCNRLSVIPIPLHAQRLQERGFNQAEVLARSFCLEVGCRCFPHALSRIKNTKPQIQTKSKQERETNLERAFAVGQVSELSQSVILLDDIYTSGATVHEAIAALKTSGINVRAVVVLAKPKFGV